MHKIPNLIVVLVVLPWVCLAQAPTVPLKIHGTSSGIFVTFGNPELVGKEVDVYRKGQSESDFQKIATLTPPRSIDDLRQKIASAKSVFATYAQPSDKNLAQTWNAYQKNPAQLSTLLATIPQLAYVFNLAYWDTNVRAGQSYQYQLRSNQKTLVTSPVYAYTGRFSFPALQWVKDTTLQKLIRMDFVYSTTLLHYVDMEVKRKLFTDRTNAYKPQPVLVTTTRQEKKRYVSLTDTSLKQYSSYHYQIRQRSIFGQTDTASTYITASNVTERLMPSVVRLAAYSEKDQRAMHIGWQFSNPALVQSVALYRSTRPRTNFTLVGSFNASDTSATQPIEVANELYFYYLEFTDLFGNRQKSSIIHASYSGHSVPAPPHGLQSVFTQKKVQLQWKPSDRITRGYYVYRRQGQQGEFLQISAFIPATSHSYRDSSDLDGSFTYYYAVKAESDTYEKSAYSDTITVRPASTVNDLKPPTDVAAIYRDGKVEVVWENMNVQNSQVSGYQVFRKKESETNYTLLTPQPLHHNHFVDSTATTATYAYTIVSTDANGQQSKPGIPATVDIAPYKVELPERLGFEKMATQINLRWTSLSAKNIKEIRIYRAEDNQPFQLRSTSAKNTQNFVDTAAKGHVYSYRLTTIDSEGKESRPSSIVTVDF